MNPRTIDEGHELFLRIAHLCDQRPRDDVLLACINMIANCVRQHVGLRTEAEELMNSIFGQTMQIMLDNYDPVTNKRRSVVPFTQTITMDMVRKAANGST